MALTGAQKVTFYESIGLSTNQVHLINQMMARQRTTWFQESIGGVVWFRQDIADFRIEVDANLAALDLDQEAKLIVYLTQWDSIATSNLTIREAGGSRGNLADDPAERSMIEKRISNLVGIVMPSGGFYESYMELFATSEANKR